MCVLKVMETLAVSVILALQSHNNQHPRDVTPGDDVSNMATSVWAEPDPQHILGGRDRKLLCGLTATVRPAEEGSGSVEEDKDADEDKLHFTHFIFRNRMQISQHC